MPTLSLSLHSWQGAKRLTRSYLMSRGFGVSHLCYWNQTKTPGDCLPHFGNVGLKWTVDCLGRLSRQWEIRFYFFYSLMRNIVIFYNFMNYFLLYFNLTDGEEILKEKLHLIHCAQCSHLLSWQYPLPCCWKVSFLCDRSMLTQITNLNRFLGEENYRALKLLGIRVLFGRSHVVCVTLKAKEST